MIVTIWDIDLRRKLDSRIILIHAVCCVSSVEAALFGQICPFPLLGGLSANPEQRTE